MSRRTRVLVWLVVLAGLTLSWVGFATLTRTPFPGVSRENALRLRRGMTIQEIQAILGGEGSHCLSWTGRERQWTSEDQIASPFKVVS